MDDRFRGCVPLVIGVIGHRQIDPQHEAALLTALEKVIGDYKKAYPHTPIVVLTSLAQGADLLAAKAAEKCGVTIRAALPMPQDAYRASTSFDNEDERKKFDAALRFKDVELLELSMPAELGSPPGAWMDVAQSKVPEFAEYRRKAYAAAGVYLVRHSDILVALWDGAESPDQKPSGTAEHVALKLNGTPPQLLGTMPDEPLGVFSDRGPVVVLHAPRQGSPDTGKKIGAYELRTPVKTHHSENGVLQTPAHGRNYGYASTLPIVDRGDESGWAEAKGWFRFEGKKYGELFTQDLRAWLTEKSATPFHPPTLENLASDDQWARRETNRHRERCEVVESFNADVQRLPDSDKSGGGEWQAVQPVVRAAEAPWLERVCGVRGVAGKLARDAYEPWIHWVQIGIFGCLFATLVLFHIYAHKVKHVGEHLSQPNRLWLGLALGALSAAFGLHLFATMKRWDGRRIDYRALAEALRVRLWWCVAGVRRSVALAYPAQVRGEVSWIRQAVRNVSGPSGDRWAFAENPTDVQRGEQLARLKLVRDRWIAAQVKQHHVGLAKQERRAKILRGGGLISAAVGWILMAVMLLRPELHDVDHTVLILIGVFTIAGGLAIGYSERRTHEELARQYERAHQVFRNGLREFDARFAVGDVEGCQRICEALGVEALNENGQWLIVRRGRPVEIHVA